MVQKSRRRNPVYNQSKKSVKSDYKIYVYGFYVQSKYLFALIGKYLIFGGVHFWFQSEYPGFGLNAKEKHPG